MNHPGPCGQDPWEPGAQAPGSVVSGRRTVNAMDVLWRVVFYGRETRPATAVYQFENLHRLPAGHSIAQIVEDGEVLVRGADGREHLATAGHAFLFRYGEDSAYGFPPGNTLPYRTTWISLEGSGLADHWDLLTQRSGPVIPATTEIRAAMTHLADLAQPQARCDPAVMALAVHAFVLQLVSSAREQERSQQAPVERAIDDLLANPAAPWSLKEVAERHGVSREHLTRAFLGRVGQPPATWLNQARVSKALHLLRQTDIPVRDVVQQAGFSSTHTMARLVKEATGRAPSHFREEDRP